MGARAPRWLPLVPFGLGLVWLACGSSYGESSDPDAGVEASVPDVVVDDVKAADTNDPGLTSFGDSANWSTFAPPDTSGDNWYGSAWDGRYVYFSSYQSTVLRYDTTGAFDVPESWQSFDPSDLGFKITTALSGIVADGWIYFLPNYNAQSGAARVAYRYRLTLPFADRSSWQVISFDKLGAAPASGAVFDGTRVVGVPFDRRNSVPPIDAGPAFVGFPVGGDDTSFPDAAAWKIEPAPVDLEPIDFAGAALVGGYIFSSGVLNPRLVRTAANLATPPDAFPLPLDGGKTSPSGGIAVISDGRYLYLPQLLLGGSASGVVVRYDTTEPFLSASSYTTIDLAQANPELVGYTAGTFDGRFVYLTPSGSGKFVRYDTSKPFLATSFEEFDSVPTIGGSIFRVSAVFDGQYVYFPSTSDRRITRFRTRATRVPWPATTMTF